MELKLWVISVGGGIGTFFFEGTEQGAEEARIHKARWEQAIARKRLADCKEARTSVINPCKNHENFNSKMRYTCDCEHCNLVSGAPESEDAK